VLRNLRVVYTRDFTSARSSLTEESCAPTDWRLEEAGRAKKEGGLPGNYQSEVLDPFIDDMTQTGQSLAAVLSRLRFRREQPEKILVCGGCANIRVWRGNFQPRGSPPRGRSARPDEAVLRGKAQAVQTRRHGALDGLWARTAEFLTGICHA